MIEFIPDDISWTECTSMSEYELWKPAPGDTLIGVLEDMHYNSQYTNQVVYYILENGTGKRYLLYGAKVLDEKLKGVNEGDYVKIVFNGVRQGCNNKYKDYKVYIHRN